MPTKIVYLTSGRNRTLKLGSQIVEMKHAPKWMLIESHGEVGKAVRALGWLGKRRAPEALESLKRKLPASEVQRIDRGEAGASNLVGHVHWRGPGATWLIPS